MPRLLAVSVVLLNLFTALPIYASSLRCDVDLKASPSETRLEGYLGGGADANVYRVRLDGKDLVLKVFHDERTAKEQAAEIEIQQLLAEREFAPRILAVFNEEEIGRFVTDNQKQLGFFRWNVLGYFHHFQQIAGRKFAILMEDVRGQSTKYPNEGISRSVTLTQAQYENALAQIHDLDIFLKMKRIATDDLDLVITPEGKIKLIDLSRFTFVSPKEAAKLEFERSATKRFEALIHLGYVKILD